MNSTPPSLCIERPSDDKNAHLWRVDDDDDEDDGDGDGDGDGEGGDAAASSRCVRVFAGHTSHVFCVDLNSPKCNLLATGSADETVRLW